MIKIGFGTAWMGALFLSAFAAKSVPAEEPGRAPNILYAISDDQSWIHAGAYGLEEVRTPHFDRIAAEGVLFEQAFAPTPGCSPTRASILTGRHNWQIEHAGTHWSTFSRNYAVFPDRLEEAGYFIGFTGKGWAPGNTDGWDRNPAGVRFGRGDYAEGFRRFLDERPEGTPFFFWYGAHEPHPGTIRANLGSGEEAGFDLDAITVPPFLPDVPEVRGHIADYLRMIEVFDEQLGEILGLLEEAGELDSTIIIVTSDHGMGFPRAKANLYEYSVRVPLAVRWGAEVPGGRVVNDLIDLIDITATIYDVTGVAKPEEYPISGRTMLALLRSEREGLVEAERDAVYLGRERHSSARHDNFGYPMRAIRTQEFLYIRNFHPDRWPAGAPKALREDDSFYPLSHGGNAFADIDDSPTKSFLVENSDHEEYREYFLLAVGKRPAEELYDIRNDPGCLNNLAEQPQYADIRRDLAERLETHLEQSGDPRIVGPDPEVFETYPRYGGIRRYPPPEEEPEEWKWMVAP